MTHKIPSRYPFAEKAPPEGDSCATCYYLSKDEKHCRNKLYKKEHGSKDLGAEASRWCCMVWTPKGGR